MASALWLTTGKATKVAFEEALHVEKYLSIIFVCFDEKAMRHIRKKQPTSGTKIKG
jgi:hypothetical protein